MKLHSTAFGPNQPIPDAYTCFGKNQSPPLLITDTPPEAKSLALIMTDPDAPAGEWVHWTMWNIPPQTAEITESMPPKGAIEGLTSFQENGYGGPCPPGGTHRYVFDIFALDTELLLPTNADKDTLVKAMQGHILAQAELIGLCKAR